MILLILSSFVTVIVDVAYLKPMTTFLPPLPNDVNRAGGESTTEGLHVGTWDWHSYVSSSALCCLNVIILYFFVTFFYFSKCYKFVLYPV